jgi:hypothetical protein
MKHPHLTTRVDIDREYDDVPSVYQELFAYCVATQFSDLLATLDAIDDESPPVLSPNWRDGHAERIARLECAVTEKAAELIKEKI